MALKHKHWEEAAPTTLAEGVAPLTMVERAWVRKFASVMADMPTRLLLIESGDSVMVVDRPRSRDVALEDGKARRNGVVLADVRAARLKITGVAS